MDSEETIAYNKGIETAISLVHESVFCPEDRETILCALASSKLTVPEELSSSSEEEEEDWYAPLACAAPHQQEQESTVKEKTRPAPPPGQDAWR